MVGTATTRQPETAPAGPRSGRPTVLVLVKHYLPGYKSGGPIRSLANLVDHLGEEINFVVLTGDRDSGDYAPYADVVDGRAQQVGKATVIYLAPAATQYLGLRRWIGEIRPDVLYVNSIFARQFGIIPCFLWRSQLRNRMSLVVAPRGELSVGALALNRRRKHAFLALSHRLGLHRGVTWQASSFFEAEDIRRCIPTSRADAGHSIVVASDLLPRNHEIAGGTRVVTKRRGTLRVVYLSRLVPKKNLIGALRILAAVRGEVSFSIYGTREDKQYWAACQREIAALPGHIRVEYRGAIEHAQVQRVLGAHDLFLFPTHGENYGHVIVEALAAGCPVLVSDQTPWRQLESAGVGWDVPLDQPETFRAVIERCIDMDGPTFGAWSARASALARQHAANQEAVEANRRLFRGVIADHQAGGRCHVSAESLAGS